MVLDASNTPYIEATEEALDCSFRSFEINQVMSEKATKKPVKGLSTQQLLLKKKGWIEGVGLGRCLQGRAGLIELLEKTDIFGLGFRPSRKDREKMMEKRRCQRMAKFQREKFDEKIFILPLSESFISASKVMTSEAPLLIQVAGEFEGLSICAIGEEASSSKNWIYVAGTDTELGNWAIREIPTGTLPEM